MICHKDITFRWEIGGWRREYLGRLVVTVDPVRGPGIYSQSVTDAIDAEIAGYGDGDWARSHGGVYQSDRNELTVSVRRLTGLAAMARALAEHVT